jgi:hypothetical protein
LFGRAVPSPAGDFQAGLQIAHLAFWIGDRRLILDGLRLADVMEWAEGEIRSRGLDPAALRKPLHFSIPPHPVAEGGRFAWHGRESEFSELAGHYVLASESLEDLRSRLNGSEVRCWPHHFDIATLIDLGEGRSVGAGMSPGDEGNSQPYFYVNVWPYPKPEKLPPLPVGRWNTEGWTGAVLTGRDGVRDFLQSATSILISLAKE